ncbi:hypothetical protein CRENPOLYSF2_1870016 [Crenothrix polyspora]|uniref:Uncharacterized protein n=1 Tax=Crenothrix polyspora TaxID=360316 RepID=A0A1R4H3T1_9GAMM|nr:hypothetical protein CRENPOLYSF2_1870016 [Crenothrix polyspora]
MRHERVKSIVAGQRFCAFITQRSQAPSDTPFIIAEFRVGTEKHMHTLLGY